jgi:hypothetical protein
MGANVNSRPDADVLAAKWLELVEVIVTVYGVGGKGGSSRLSHPEDFLHQGLY